MHRSRLPLTTWFWAAHLMTTHSNGMSALQLHETLLGLAADKEPASYWDIIKRDNPRKSASRAGSAPLLHIDEPESAG